MPIWQSLFTVPMRFITCGALLTALSGICTSPLLWELWQCFGSDVKPGLNAKNND